MIEIRSSAVVTSTETQRLDFLARMMERSRFVSGFDELAANASYVAIASKFLALGLFKGLSQDAKYKIFLFWLKGFLVISVCVNK
jgi:hypothetical protein